MVTGVLAFSLLSSCTPENTGKETPFDDTVVIGRLPSDRGKVKSEAGAYSSWDCKYDVSNAVWGVYESIVVDSLGVVPKEADPVNKYGSWNNGKTFEKTGFFRVEKYRGRWIIVDPEGKMHIDAGVLTVSPGGGKVNKTYFAKVFQNKEKWISDTMDSLCRYGFNGSGAWGDEEQIRQYNKISSTRKCTYCPIVNPMSDFGYHLGIASHNPGNTGYEGGVIPVFHSEFKDFAEKLISGFVAPYKDDPDVLGYFTDNEMPLRLSNLESCLALDASNPERKAAEAWMKENNVTKITDNVRLQFVGYLAETYYSIVSEALRKADPNHLYLGSRLAGTNKTFETVYKAAAQYCDIVSINYYGQWQVRPYDIERWEKWADRPFMITEFYTKAEDSGLGNTSGDGWIVRDQKTRGIHYENFIIGLLRTKCCVGWSWCKYLDNDPTASNPEPSNKDSNKGIFDNYYKPYPELVESMRKVNTVRYSILSQNWLYTK